MSASKTQKPQIVKLYLNHMKKTLENELYLCYGDLVYLSASTGTRSVCRASTSSSLKTGIKKNSLKERAVHEKE